MRNDELCWMSAWDLARAVARRRVSPVEVVDAVLDRIGRLKSLNAYCLVDAEGARRAAKVAEREATKRRARLGPLHGVPFSVKDLVVTKGLTTTFGTPLYRENVPTEDAPSVERMKRAGAIMLGKTNTPTLGWVGVTDNLLFGATVNPWSRDHTPGGSSGGAGAAVAAGLGPLAIGTDGGGSIRKPAAWCGIFGLKASYGRVAVHPHGAAWSLSHAGPMTRTVRDAALMLNAVAGPDERDQYSLPADSTDYVKALRGSLKGLRVAYSDFEKWDLLLSPTVACPPLRLGEWFATEIGGKPVGRDAGSVFTFPFNMTGQPAATVPCGFTKAGLPIGLQVVGRRFADALVLRASAAIETAQPWADRRPEPGS